MLRHFGPVLLFSLAASASGALIERSVEYREGDTQLEGFLAYDDEQASPRPGVLIIHQWRGLTDYEKMRARMLAKLGYVAFALDIYGKGVRPESNEEAAQTAARFKSDRQLFRRRALAGLAALRELEQADAGQTAAIGYCFGGTGVLELARSGADFDGAVSFHGGLGSPTPEDAANIKAKVLAFHGADDPHVPAEEVKAFAEEMSSHDVDWHLVVFGGAVHSFTQKAAGDDPSNGVAYDAAADERSWNHLKVFLRELFGHIKKSRE